MGSYLSISSLNVNGLNAPNKRQRLAEWIQKQDPCCLKETHLKTKDMYRLKVKGWKKKFHAIGDQNKAPLAYAMLCDPEYNPSPLPGCWPCRALSRI